MLTDSRDPLLITHRQVDLLRQRIFGLALGYEDLNDHDTLRRDLAWQTGLPSIKWTYRAQQLGY